ncbi:MAG: response regulator [Candidatus Omnitrophota bacterium]|nr:response regulator [Candidatus Omnitrophota bacterium]
MDKKILIVEDNKTDFLIVKRYLARAGYHEIVSAENVAEGIKKAEIEKPDLIILDTVLPDGNGFEICQAIREKYNQTNPKIIITTSSVDAVDAVRARKAGADDYCAKTFDCAPLLEALKRIT